MIEIDELQLLSPEEELAAIKHTNMLFLNLLYNLSRYPRMQMAKRFVRMGLFEFETEIFPHRQIKSTPAKRKKALKK